MVSAVYILHWSNHEEYSHSQLLLHRRYQNDIPLNDIVVSRFDELYGRLKIEERVPFLYYKGLSYSYIQVANDLLLLAVSTQNINAMLIAVFLHSFYQVLYRYLCNTKNAHNQDKTIRKLDKDIITDNINFIFELLDECMDFGLIQLTDYNLLKEYIKVEVNLPREQIEDDEGEANKKLKVSLRKNIKSTKGQSIKDDVLSKQNININSSILRTSSLAINWRPKGVFYVKNEIYLDIVEDCHFFYDLESNIIRRNEIYGTCTAICYLSGMPVCQLGFNEDNISGIDSSDLRKVKDNKNNLLKPEEDDEELLVDDEGSDKLHSRIPIRNIQFHQCVELPSIYEDNLVKFIPPDDTFVLMTYQVEQQKQSRKLPLFMIRPTYRYNSESKKLQILCTLTTNFKKRLHCRDLVIQIPIDPNLFQLDVNFDAENLKYKSELGEVSFKIDTSELIWKFDDITGRKTIRMMVEVQLDETNISYDTIRDHFNLQNSKSEVSTQDDGEIDESLDEFYGVNGHTGSAMKNIVQLSKSRNDFNIIVLSFSIPIFTYSGIKVNYLTVDEEQMKYTCFPWVKYLTRSQSSFNKRPENQGLGGQNCFYRFKLGSSCFQII